MIVTALDCAVPECSAIRGFGPFCSASHSTSKPFSRYHSSSSPRPMSCQLTLLALLSPTGQRGWISTALLAAVIVIPYLNSILIRGARRADSANALAPLMPLWPHYWLGLLLVSVSSWHSWPALRAGHIPPSLTNGLWLATIALALLFVQLAVGAALRYRSPGPSGLSCLRSSTITCTPCLGRNVSDAHGVTAWPSTKRNR